jgi:hypothetical protein
MNTSQAICRMREVIRRQHKALSTEGSYIFWLRRYMTALREMPEGLSSEKKLEQFLTDLARRRNVSASTQNQALNAKQMQNARSVWQHDKQDGTPLMLPHRLARKYPEYRFSWGWAWLFPAHYTCRDPITRTLGETSLYPLETMVWAVRFELIWMERRNTLKTQGNQ